MPLALAEVLTDHWPDYARRNRSRLVTAHYRAVRAVTECRSPAMGGHLYKCEHCHTRHYAYHSCNHRNCPQCGALDQQRWCATQEARLLPGVPYYLVTFTIPDSLWPLCKQHPAILYNLLLRESAGALQDLAQTKLGGRLGMTAVLHTNGRQMQHHPHVHIVLPAVAFDPATRTLRHPNDPKKFFVHETPLALRFRNRIDIALKDAHPDIHRSLSAQARRDLNSTKWRIDCKPVGQGQPAVRYLARYVYKTALGPNRLKGYTKDGRIRLSYQDSTTKKWGVTALQPDTFLERFLTHVLPKGFVRVRHFGWLSGAARKTRLLVRALVCGEIGEPAPKLPETPTPCCPDCGAALTCIATLAPIRDNRGPPR
ncbi:MAG: transposase [Shimia sp.]|nr:transposase [Shimia sp.]